MDEAQRLIQQLHDMGISDADIAYVCDVSRTYINLVKHGRKKASEQLTTRLELALHRAREMDYRPGRKPYRWKAGRDRRQEKKQQTPPRSPLPQETPRTLFIPYIPEPAPAPTPILQKPPQITLRDRTTFSFGEGLIYVSGRLCLSCGKHVETQLCEVEGHGKVRLCPDCIATLAGQAVNNVPTLPLPPFEHRLYEDWN
jgi:hypothetical protein